MSDPVVQKSEPIVQKSEPIVPTIVVSEPVVTKKKPEPEVEPEPEAEKAAPVRMEYIVEEDIKKDAFLKKVNARMAKGWVLQGGLSVDWNYPPGIVAAYRQALVRYG
jgi:SAM-dependent MidA family methyltransferase